MTYNLHLVVFYLNCTTRGNLPCPCCLLSSSGETCALSYANIDMAAWKKSASRGDFKSTDMHALLYKTLYHSKHTHKGRVKSQLIGFRRICSFKEVVEIATRTLFKVLRLRGYACTLFRSIEAEVRQTFGHPEFKMTRNEGKHFNHEYKIICKCILYI